MSEAATKADITELLEVFRESNARLQSSFAEELKAAKTRIQEENKKSVEVLERKLAAVSENKWKREGNRRQFEFNHSVEEEINKAIEEPVDAQVHLKKAKDLIAGRQKLIKLADQSEHGWATVAEYETNELAADEDDEKRMQRAESRAGKKIKQKQNAKQSSKKRFKQGESRLDIFDPSGNKLFRGGVGSNSSSSSSARGSCFFCGQFGHWKESCPARRRERFQAAKQATGGN